jgi:hypothetical protein
MICHILYTYFLHIWMKIYHNYYFSTAFDQLYCIVILLFLLQDTCPTKETGTMYLYFTIILILVGTCKSLTNQISLLHSFHLKK